jgi:hypothetical protein
MTDSFADHPPSIGEIRADKTDRAADWIPRDILISLLREIDDGTLDVDAMVVLFRRNSGDRGQVGRVGWRVASPDAHTTIGIVASGLYRMQNQLDLD